MKQVQMDYGLIKMPVELPNSAVVVRYGKSYEDPPSVDPFNAMRKALDSPLEMPTLKSLASPGKTAAIVFPE